MVFGTLFYREPNIYDSVISHIHMPPKCISSKR